jgi:hypothetical protein
MAGKGSRRDVTLSKTARASIGDKGAASTVDWSRHFCDECGQRMKLDQMVTVRELSPSGNAIKHYHKSFYDGGVCATA